MSHKPTDEQQQVIDAFRSADRPTIVTQAGAGCGKSSTLKMAAQTQPHRKGLYVAYNKALAVSARADFPPAVDCRTAHSLAFGPVGRHYRDRLNGPRVPARQVAEFLGFNSPVQIAGELAPLAPTTLARLVMELVGRFLNSADDEPGMQHGPRVDGYSRADNRALGQYLVPYARKAWDDLQLTTGGRLKFTHDVYLKLYQLSRPRIPVDYVLLDEAQDLSPVMASLFHFQTHAQRIMVGDSAQAIYGFRGAIDAMAKFEADQRLTLSQSFRFGPEIAAEANKWLDLLDAPLRLRGFPPARSTVEPILGDPDAILCRSNAGAIAQVMHAAATGRRPALVGGGDDIKRLAEAARELIDGSATSHPELVAFKTWDQVREHAAQDDASGNLQVLVKLIDDYGPTQIIQVVNSLVAEPSADVVISTAHKAKGREWDRVRIAGDFREPRIDPVTRRAKLVPDELMLAYVAVTRARVTLDRLGLAWVDWFTRPAPVPPPAAVAPARPVPEHAILPDAPDPLAADTVLDTTPDGPDRMRADEHRACCWLCTPSLRDSWPAPVPAGAPRG
ncbi:UvrD-helicase domain-containing protein [Micromonospora sp. HUAS LYJ1]|uniref:UvrD-helicase domain-containing protein n=1 Tax=Micromonospora sp. HUAS LYJ1 TaxID=3061626 RepID=UPI0026741E93|nr:UvrD-helicase domain-containing protein [Micromonospora sp. HUAS LYJ1]WKU03726.1 UvrD-helicase domain-containing protein [Micromonospora sp. HUAS LYJ1]